MPTACQKKHRRNQKKLSSVPARSGFHDRRRSDILTAINIINRLELKLIAAAPQLLPPGSRSHTCLLLEELKFPFRDPQRLSTDIVRLERVPLALNFRLKNVHPASIRRGICSARDLRAHALQKNALREYYV